MEKMAYTADTTPNATTKAGDKHLLSMFERLVRLEDEKAGLSADISDIYKEAKSSGYDSKALRLNVKWHRETAEQADARKLMESTAEMMAAALGAFSDSDLGRAAIEKAREVADRHESVVNIGGRRRMTRADVRAAIEATEVQAVVS